MCNSARLLASLAWHPPTADSQPLLRRQAPRPLPSKSIYLTFTTYDLHHTNLPRVSAVNRLVCKGMTYETELFLDIASEVYSLREGERFTLTLASTLRLDGKPDEDTYNQDGKPSLLDDYDYGMCGKVFKYEYLGEHRV